jgi:TonB family protein
MLSLLAGITVLISAAFLLTTLLRRASAALRHVVWTCAVAATLLYAPLRWLVPQHTVVSQLPAVFNPGMVTPAVVVQAVARQDAISFAQIVTFVWMFGSLVLALRLAVKSLQFRRVVAGAKPVVSACPVRILRTALVPGPLVTGILRPTIVLPEDSFLWEPARRRAVLAHEIAHIRRRDPAILLAAHITTIIYWFHPLCWLAAARLRMESERACDDSALRIGLRPSGYAGQLLDLARLFNPQPAIPMATTSHLESRVKSILDPFVNRSFAARGTWLAAVFIAAAVVAPLTVLRLHAQGNSGTVIGNITDPTGAVVARAQVILSNLQGGNKEVVKSDMIGNFEFDNITAGNYSAEARVPGFAPFRLDFALIADGTAKVPIRLTVGGVGEQITVVAAGSPKPQTFAAIPHGSGPIRVGGNVKPATLIQQTRPVYPAVLQAAGVEGTVLLEAIISKTGDPITLTPQNTAVDAAFVSAAMDAVRQWRYQPAMLNGQAIDIITTITIDFKLQATPTAKISPPVTLDQLIAEAESELAEAHRIYKPEYPGFRAMELKLAKLRSARDGQLTR